jgi:hypothetical protein
VLPALHASAIARGYPPSATRQSVRLAYKIARVDGVAAEEAVRQIKEFQSMPIVSKD